MFMAGGMMPQETMENIYPIFLFQPILIRSRLLLSYGVFLKRTKYWIKETIQISGSIKEGFLMKPCMVRIIWCASKNRQGRFTEPYREEALGKNLKIAV